MSFTYYNQLNYKHITYANKEHPAATIATSGCGVCSIAMVLSVFDIKKQIETLANYSIKIGARVSTGTDMQLLSNRIAADYNLKLELSNSIGTLKNAIEHNLVAICNVGGDRVGYKGIFSDSGHYIVVYGTHNGKAVVYDPYFYQNKYDKTYRQVVTVGKNNQLYCDFKYIEQDCSNRSPRYYIFSKGEKQVEEITNVYDAIKLLSEKGIITNRDYWDKAVNYYKNIDFLLIKMANYIK